MSWIVFDVDGVLIDVDRSYDVAVKLTVERSLESAGKTVDIDLNDIKRLRKKGIFPDDFKLCEALILGLMEYGVKFLEIFPDGEDVSWIRDVREDHIKPSSIKRIFNTYYLGNKFENRLFDTRGLYTKEKRIIDLKLLEKAEELFDIGVVTGRNDLEMRLAEEVIGHEFDHVITRDYAIKPDPICLDKIGAEEGVYIGDTETDRRLVERYNQKKGKGFEFRKVDDDQDVNQVLGDI
ncbi:MAG: HAD family hydrolase, partial [Candidatus Natronoplasma sp.]